MEKLPLTLYPSKIKYILLLLLSLGFVLGEIFIIKNSNSHEKNSESWFGMFFFGLGVLVFAINLLPNAAYLKITDNGIEIRSLFKSSFTSWDVITCFDVGNIDKYGKKMVMFNYDENYKKQFNGRKIAKFLARFGGGLPDTYGLKAEDLAKLLNNYKNKFNKFE